MSNLERALIAKILAEHGARDDARLFRNATANVFAGRFKAKLDDGSLLLHPGWSRMKAGLTEGSSDLIGIKRVWIPEPQHVGLFTAIEVKAGSTRDAAHQERFVEMVIGLGGLAGFARSVDEATAIIEGQAP